MAKDDSFLTLKKQLKEKNTGNLYLFFGEEVFIRDMYLEHMKKLVPDNDFSDFNNIILDGKDLTQGKADDTINSFPVMAEKKIIIIKNSGIFKACPEDSKAFWEETLSLIPDYVLLIFVEDEINKKNVLFKAVSKYGLCVNFEYQKDYEIIPWVIREAKKAGKKMSKDAAELLVSLCDPGLINIKNELDKLISYAGEEIYRSDIEKVVSRPMSLAIFEITDAIAEKNADKALSMIMRLKENKESAFNIIYLLSSSFDKMLNAKLMLENGATYDMIASNMKLSPFIAKKYIASSKNFSQEFLMDRIIKTAKIDLAIKQGELEEWTALFSYVAECLK